MIAVATAIAAGTGGTDPLTKFIVRIEFEQ